MRIWVATCRGVQEIEILGEIGVAQAIGGEAAHLQYQRQFRPGGGIEVGIAQQPVVGVVLAVAQRDAYARADDHVVAGDEERLVPPGVAHDGPVHAGAAPPARAARERQPRRAGRIVDLAGREQARHA